MGFHSKASLGARHPIHNWEYADATARGAASGFVSADLGKVAKQTDDNSLWQLTATTPTWKAIDAGGVSTHDLGGSDHNVDTLANLNSKISDATLIDTTDSRLSDSRTDDDAIHDNVSAEINAIAEKTSPVGADVLVIEDSAASFAKKKVQITNLPGGSDADAIHDNVAAEISAVAEKGTPASADLLLIEDSADSNNKKRVQVGNLPGGFSSPLTTKGDLHTYDTADQRLAVGTNGHVLTADSAEATGIKWAAVGSGTDADAIHDNVAAEISAITEKTTPVSADLLVIEDSADSNNKKRVQIGNLPSAGGGGDVDMFEDANHPDWDFAIKKWDFLGDASTFIEFSSSEPSGDAGNFALQAEKGGAVRVYVNDTTVGNYIEVDHGNFWNLPVGTRLAVRVARKANTGSLAHKFAVYMRMNNASAVDRNLAGFYCSAGGNWFAVSADQTAEETTDTGIDSSDGNYHWLEWHVEASQVRFWIDGTLEATHTTELPSATYGEFVMRGEVLESATGNEDKNWIDAIVLRVPRAAGLI